MILAKFLNCSKFGHKLLIPENLGDILVCYSGSGMITGLCSGLIADSSEFGAICSELGLMKILGIQLQHDAPEFSQIRCELRFLNYTVDA